MTDCTGMYAVIVVPAESVQDDLPPPYRAKGFVSGTANLGIEFHLCNKVAVGGVDVGKASYFALQAAIQDPRGGPQDFALYALETRTDNDVLREWLSEKRLPTTSGNLTLTNTSAPRTVTLSAQLNGDDGTTYDCTGVVDDDNNHVLDDEVVYFGAQGARFYDNQSVAISNSGGGSLEASPTSTLSKVLDGQTRWAAAATAAWLGARQLELDPGAAGTNP